MKKHGFTLIELLAVIVILAILALIATPIILNVIDSAKKGAAENSAYGYINAVEDYFARSLVNGQQIQFVEGMNRVPLNGVEITGKGPIDGWLLVGKKTVENYQLQFDDYLVEYNPVSKKAVAKKGNLEDTIKTIKSVAESLVYQNGSCKTDGSTYRYMGGCYLKGAQTENYLWYSGYLWRIMGINEDGTVRLINQEPVAVTSYHATTPNYDGSDLDNWLNEIFYPSLKGKGIVKESAYCEGTATSTLPSRSDCNGGTIINRQVGTISIDEYALAGLETSYLRIGQFFWTLSPYDGTSMWLLRNGGDAASCLPSYPNGIRPIINIDGSAIITDGNGKLSATWNDASSPYILNDYKKTELTGYLNNQGNSGEYVQFSGKKYRIIGHDNDGNTKLLLDSFYEEGGIVFNQAYGANSNFVIDSGIGQKLNTDVLTWLVASSDIQNQKKLVVNYPWYQTAIGWGSPYQESLNEEGIPTFATVGLIRVGELLSGQSYTILTKNGTVESSLGNSNHYWALNASTTAGLAWNIPRSGNGNMSATTLAYSVRPVLVIKAGTLITGGNGTPSSPYQI